MQNPAAYARLPPRSQMYIEDYCPALSGARNLGSSSSLDVKRT